MNERLGWRTDWRRANWLTFNYVSLPLSVAACLKASLLQTNHIDHPVSSSSSRLSRVIICGLLRIDNCRSWVLLDNLIISQLFRKCIAFYRIRVYNIPPLALSSIGSFQLMLPNLFFPSISTVFLEVSLIPVILQTLLCHAYIIPFQSHLPLPSLSILIIFLRGRSDLNGVWIGNW
jgi:hypothetical protein